MLTLFESLPGQVLPVAEVPQAMKAVWGYAEGAESTQRPDFRAVQMNLILHFGLHSSPESAIQVFNSAVSFSQNHPCRIIVLCPSHDVDSAQKAKLFSQCYIADGMNNISASDAIILSYKEEEGHFLEYQVSIWIDNDLPTYHWVHGVDPLAIHTVYASFLQQCTKIIYDSACDAYDMDSVIWPNAIEKVDLSYVRILNARKSIAQFLSEHKPAIIIQNLDTVVLSHSPKLKAEGLSLLAWVKSSLLDCAKMQSINPSLHYKIEPASDKFAQYEGLYIEFQYLSNFYFKWTYVPETAYGFIECNFNHTVHYPLQIYPLSAEQTLIQAILF